MSCNRQELVIVMYAGTLAVQGTGNLTIKSILTAMSAFYPGGKTFLQPRIIKVAEQTLFKESFVEHNLLPRGRLKQHAVAVIDQEKCKKKVRKMLGGFVNGVWALDMTRVKQILN